MAMEFDKLLVTGVERGASDLHLKANSPVVLRIHGRLVPQGDLGVITGEDMEAIARRCLTERMYTQLKDGREVRQRRAIASMSSPVITPRSPPRSRSSRSSGCPRCSSSSPWSAAG